MKRMNVRLVLRSAIRVSQSSSDFGHGNGIASGRLLDKGMSLFQSRCFGAQAEIVQSFKGHGMLAPFTAGWQTTELDPMVMDRAPIYMTSMEISTLMLLLAYGALPWVQAVVKKNDILFIADEVVCALGRLGELFGCDKYNIKPDLVSMAKALSSAYVPIRAILISPEVADVVYSQSNKLGAFSHGFTYSGHPVSCAVALEALKIYKERNIVERGKSLTPRFQDGLKAFSESPIIGEIRGTGLILGTEFADNKSPNDPFPPEWVCHKHGMLVRVLGDTIILSPPLTISEEEIDQMISIYGKALKDTEERVKEVKSPHVQPSVA